MRLVVLSLCIALHVQAKEVLYEGHVYVNKSKDTIPYVNLSFLKILKGTSTDEEGHYIMDLPTLYLENQVHISPLRYKDTIFASKQLFSIQQFDMVEESFELDEVVVTEKLGNSDVFNPISSYSLTSGFSLPTFRGVYTQNQNYKVTIYGMGEWTDFKVRSRNNTKNFIPAKV